MDIRTAQRAAMWSGSLIAAVGALRMVAAIREVERSGSQDALIAVFTSALILAGAYGVYRTSRIETSVLLVYSAWMVALAFTDESVGTLGVVGVVLFALVVTCGAAAAWLRPREAKRRSHPEMPHSH